MFHILQEVTSMKAMLHFTSCNTHNQYIRMYLFLTSSSNHTGHTHTVYYTCVGICVCTQARAQFRGHTFPVGAAAINTGLHRSTPAPTSTGMWFFWMTLVPICFYANRPFQRLQVRVWQGQFKSLPWPIYSMQAPSYFYSAKCRHVNESLQF